MKISSYTISSWKREWTPKWPITTMTTSCWMGSSASWAIWGSRKSKRNKTRKKAQGPYISIRLSSSVKTNKDKRITNLQNKRDCAICGPSESHSSGSKLRETSSIQTSNSATPKYGQICRKSRIRLVISFLSSFKSKILRLRCFITYSTLLYQEANGRKQPNFLKLLSIKTITLSW